MKKFLNASSKKNKKNFNEIIFKAELVGTQLKIRGLSYIIGGFLILIITLFIGWFFYKSSISAVYFLLIITPFILILVCYGCFAIFCYKKGGTLSITLKGINIPCGGIFLNRVFIRKKEINSFSVIRNKLSDVGPILTLKTKDKKQYYLIPAHYVKKWNSNECEQMLIRIISGLETIGIKREH